jgi:hypothetical protein
MFHTTSRIFDNEDKEVCREKREAPTNKVRARREIYFFSFWP